MGNHHYVDRVAIIANIGQMSMALAANMVGRSMGEGNYPGDTEGMQMGEELRRGGSSVAGVCEAGVSYYSPLPLRERGRG